MKRRTPNRHRRDANHPPVHEPPILTELNRLRDIARRLGDLAERVLTGQGVGGNPWKALLCEQDAALCPD